MKILKMSSLTYFIPHEDIVCDDRGPPWIPWITTKIKKVCSRRRNTAYGHYQKGNKSIQLFQVVQYFKKPPDGYI